MASAVLVVFIEVGLGLSQGPRQFLLGKVNTRLRRSDPVKGEVDQSTGGQGTCRKALSCAERLGLEAP